MDGPGVHAEGGSIPAYDTGLAPRATAWACRRRALLKLAPPFSFLYVAIQQSGSSYPLSLLKRASSGVVRMQPHHGTNRTMELVMKEALSIRTTPEDARFNRDNGYELPDCWIATYKKLKGGASLSSARRRHAHAVARGARPGMRTD